MCSALGLAGPCGSSHGERGGSDGPSRANASELEAWPGPGEHWRRRRPSPLDRNSEPVERDPGKSHSQPRSRDAPLEEEAMETDARECHAARNSRSHRPEQRQKHRNPSELARPCHRSQRWGRGRERGYDRTQCHKVFPAYSNYQGCSGYGWSPPWPTRPHLMSGDRHRHPAKACNAREKPGDGLSDAPQGKRGLGQDHHLRASQGRGAGSPSRGHQSSHRDRSPVGAKGQEKSSALISQKSGLTFSREESPWPLSRNSAKETPPSSGTKEEKERVGPDIQLPPPLQQPSDNDLKKKTQRKPNLAEISSLDCLVLAEGAGGLLPKVKEKIFNNQKIQEGKVRPPHLDGKPVASLPEVQETDVDNKCKPPIMSFESYLSYDQTGEKKIMKISATALEEKGHEKHDSSENLDSIQELPKASENKSEKLQPSGNVWAKLEKVSTDALPVQPDFPSPGVQANYHLLPAFEVMSSFRPKQKALSLPQEEAGFTGCRMNSKMQVFSGSRCAYPQKMMTLHQQCIWILKNNINSISKVGGVPYSVLEPILESCAPDQLYRIKKYNHVLVKETDKLWKIHCHQNFRKETPKEHESWREMYLRLQDAQKQQLQALTVNIQSFHANKPKGQQAKMILFNSVARPLSDIRRKQKRFEIGRTALLEGVKIKPAQYPTGSSCTPSINSNLNLIHEKSDHTCSSTTSIHLTRVVSGKKPAKKITPMMAKTIKDFKNRFSRR
uniref:Elongin-A n=1 Tax=Sus scrofa TaxID=9823 RepID=A0A8D1SV10_PIG